MDAVKGTDMNDVFKSFFNARVVTCPPPTFYVDPDEKGRFAHIQELHAFTWALQSKLFSTNRRVATSAICEVDTEAVRMLYAFCIEDRATRTLKYTAHRDKLRALANDKKTITAIFRHAPKMWSTEERLQKKAQFLTLVKAI
jgi:hypothetical protein